MDFGSDPLLNSLNAVKDAYKSMDASIRKAVRDLELHREGLNKMGGSLGLSVVGNESGDFHRKIRVCVGVKNKDLCSAKAAPIRGIGGVNDLRICENGFNDFGVGKDGAIKNCMELGLVWSVLVNTFCQVLAGPSKMGNKTFRKKGNAASGGVCLKSHLGASAASLTYISNKEHETGGEIIGVFGGSFVEKNGEKHEFLDPSASFLFYHFCKSLQEIHQNMTGYENNILTGSSSFTSKKGVGEKENGLFQNLRFARLGVPPSMVEVTSTQEVKSDGKITRKEDNIEPSSSRRLPGDVHVNSPEYLRSTVSTVSLSELEHQLEHPFQDHLEHKELLPQHGSVRCIKSEVVDRISGSEYVSTSVEVAASEKDNTENVLKSALAGGFSCALSSFIMHPVDTVKTQVQASTLSLPEVISMLPQIGYQGLYRGIVPAVVGQFSSHGLRTGICETIKFILVSVAPTMPDIQVESVSSFCGTILGTTTRIPSEVLKQRMQAGLYDSLGEAIVGTWKQDGLKAFFRGTGATLCREIPFYVAGMGLYTESKKVVQKIIGRQLEPWEIVVVGAVSGGLAAVTTTPFDVIKTRMMIATGGSPESMSAIALSILRQEGPLGLFKGAVPRFFWVAPLGAMNFAGYELARKALG
ncbi:unnamed protein product [Rhodiola kirilowii]